MQPSFCTNCGGQLWPGHTSCGNCGHYVAPLGAQAPGAPHWPSSQGIGPAASHVQLQQNVADYEQRIRALKGELDSVEEALELQSFGFYRAHYDLPRASDYEDMLKRIRAKQAALIRSGRAWETDSTWTLGGSAKAGQEMAQKQAKLMLRAFNGECDASIGKVKYDNVQNLEKRIYKSCEAINKLGHTIRVQITRAFYELKLAELRLVHEHREKLQEEKELERERREQMREEERAQKEIEKAQKEAEEEEARDRRALEKAQAELARADSGKQTEKLAALVAKLESELSAAIDRKAKAIARAQLTRSGHVYVLSNVGAFGEGVFKIGLTRRLEPHERVAELGDASVPFGFDVHALIFTKDAPALEAALHRRFENRRVNMVNSRREFFRVSLDEIRAAVTDLHGEVTFRVDAGAEEYRKTLALLAERA